MQCIEGFWQEVRCGGFLYLKLHEEGVEEAEARLAGYVGDGGDSPSSNPDPQVNAGNSLIGWLCRNLVVSLCFKCVN